MLDHLQVIGEAARGLSETFRQQFPDPVWSKAIGLRNILVHHYFDIEEELIWQVLDQDLHPFKESVEVALRHRDWHNQSQAPPPIPSTT